MRALAAFVFAAVFLQVPASYQRSRGVAKLRSGNRRGRRLDRDSDSVVHRTALLKTIPPFDIDPATFLSFVEAVPSDALLLFFSPTCPDCEKLMPVWAQVAGMFDSDDSLTILSVSDDAGRAPAPYVHQENPEIFFIPKGDAAHPIHFPMSDLHEFVALPETPESDKAIVDRLVAFTRQHMREKQGSSNLAASPVLPPPVAATDARSRHPLSDSQTAALNARLLATLKAKENEPVEDQLKIVVEPTYQGLPVAEFLKGMARELHRPLVQVAASYLDCLPLASQWANQYATGQEIVLRGRGWNPTVAEEHEYYQDLVKFAIPQFASNIYFQKGN